jgi:SAM-dependent methyltransferase
MLFFTAMCLLHVSAGQVSDQVFTYVEALAKCDELNLKPQTPEADGRIQTLNKKGAVTAKPDYATLEFLKYAKGKSVLEIGGAYGSVMLTALHQSKDTKYTLSDLDERHLFIASKRLAEEIQESKLSSGSKLDSDSTNQVQFIQADITKAQDINNIGTYEAILVGRVLHYLTPEQLEMTVKHLFLLLKPAGRVFIVAITPYVKRYENFIPEYERRVAAGEANPGFVQSLRAYLNSNVTTQEQRDNIADEPFFFLDDKVLRSAFENNGFRVIECKMMPLSYKSTSWELDKRENVILIAEKP